MSTLTFFTGESLENIQRFFGNPVAFKKKFLLLYQRSLSFSAGFQSSTNNSKS